jgi:hypothetical protein
MVIVFGRRSYGRVDAHGGEHAHTQFAHVYYMPIIPVSSFWVTQDLGGAARGFSIPISGKSVAAAYLRCWGPIAVLGALAAGSIGGYIVAALLAAASVFAWTWRSLRGPLVLRKSDFQMLAFGTRCDPERMPAEMRERIKHALDERWAALDVKRSPDEVAELGARSSQEAVFAYGMLRLASIDAPRPARDKAAAAARRILAGTHDLQQPSDGPYRAADQGAPAAPIFAEIASAATAHAAHKGVRVTSTPWWHPTSVKVLVAAVIGLACFLGAVEEGPSVIGAPRLTVVDSMSPTGKLVELHCQAPTQNIGEFQGGQQVSGCVVGDRIVPVVGDTDEGSTTVIGRLHTMRGSYEYVWPDAVTGSPDYAPAYLDATSLGASRAAAIACSAGLLAVLAMIGVWLRLALRRRSQRQ